MPCPGMDQRRFPRVRQACVVSLRQAPGRPSMAAITENLGVGGLCLLLDQGLDIFAPVDLELTLTDGGPPLACRGMVAWVVRRRELDRPPLFDTGIEFVGVEPQAQARLAAVVETAARALRPR